MMAQQINMIYAFDYDGVLDNPIIFLLAKKLRKENNEVWVVTMRSDNEFNKLVLQPLLTKLFLNHNNVIYCNDKPKVEMLQLINADIYIDNISDEFENIINHTNTIPLLWCNQ